jgi:hypothetical protein
MPAPKTRRRRVPAFAPVPVRARKDGWTPERQAAFIAALALTRCIRTAAARAGLSRESAYRLRARPDAASFAAAWDAILANHGQPLARKVTALEVGLRARGGLIQPVLWRGRHVANRWKADHLALLRLLAACDRSAHVRPAGCGAKPPFGVNPLGEKPALDLAPRRPIF